jgi:hypothetical protein
MLLPQGAMAVVVVDVDNFALGSGHSAAFSTPEFNTASYQTWTVERTGLLAGIELHTQTGQNYLPGYGLPLRPDFDVVLSIFRGGNATAPGAEFLGAITTSRHDLAVTSLFGETHYFDLTGLGISVAAGEGMTYKMEVEDCSDTPGCLVWGWYDAALDGPYKTTREYLGGGLFYQVDDGPLMPIVENPDDYGPGELVPPDPDLNFRTYVDVATIPEPATWALLVGGFGAAGAGLRRSRALAAS